MGAGDDLQLLLGAATDLYCSGRVRSLALERAAHFLQSVLRAEPGEARALHLLGLVELELRRPTEAAHAYRLLARSDRSELRLDGLVGLARCELARGRPKRALQVLGRARRGDLSLRRTEPEALNRFYACKAEAWLRAGEEQRARAALRRVLGRFERAGIDGDPLRYEMELCRAGGEAIASLPVLTWQAAAEPTRAPAVVYRLQPWVYRQIVRGCRGRHRERCGLLFGRGRRFERLRWLRNVDELPELGCTSPVEQRRRIWLDERRRGLSLLAEFHSHTAGPAIPSRADCAASGRLLVIYSDVFDELRAWRVGRTRKATLHAERGLTWASRRPSRG